MCGIYIDFCVVLCYNVYSGKVGQLKSAPKYMKAGDKMSLIYKFDVIAALKDKGYNTNTLRKEKLLAEGVIQALRERKPISWANISKICMLLNCQPGDLMEYVPDEH